jgi:hypothetical protein
MDEVHPIVAGRSKERPVSFPDTFLYRGRAGDGADCLATFDRRYVVLSRPVAGIACKIRTSLRQYDAIALVARDDRNIIRLAHRDPGLSVDLIEIKQFDEAEEYRDRLADALDLPVLMLAGCGASDGKQKPVPATALRRTKSIRARRPRFLARRQKGEVISIRRIEGREIIARA